ncbi:F-box and WD domain protein [Aspergillus saccharolyticus JOP 1030-1]|uniref:Probable E3 ubiquitin ligase complex SCF subunit sconB n=1 Tax=Aspergillus saccharolyticus JOP 1030-1 TaxID=1450539 RepID=A0A318ZF45_9EURO|nr:WD40 repeat-like protein [Aspergillus saccharolyticus JOP 1030-1]PYH45307.1 WD40 repeat-like protein [Aspergillus saccharolyticus JOP 1030-1]
MARRSSRSAPSPLLPPHEPTDTYSAELPDAPSLSATFRLDEGYSDETKSQAEKDLAILAADEWMTLQEWVLTHSETERAELAYNLLRSMRASTVASVIERLAPRLHMDPVQKLPPEITSEIFSYLDPQTLLMAALASRAWRNRISDSRLWKDLYINEGWRVDMDAIRTFEQEHSGLTSPQLRKSRSRHTDPDSGEPKQKKRVPPSWLNSRIAETPGRKARQETGQRHDVQEADTEGDQYMGEASTERGTLFTPEQQMTSPTRRRESQSTMTQPKPTLTGPLATMRRPNSSLLIRMPNGAAKINWLHLYRLRRKLEENWAKGRFTNFQLPHPSHMEEAHQECVYAIQFTGKWLVSGSRDKTLRVWDLDTRRLWHPPLLGHTKSVLCLQFDPRPSEDIIVSGSSDKSVIIWRFSTGEKLHEIAAAHDDSVLNLRFDERYIVTCSKDTLIKVWSRHQLSAADKDYPSVFFGSGVTYPSYIVDTAEMPYPILEAEIANGHIQSLAPYTLLMTIDGHTAAVNAIQLNEDEIVSASGDRLIKVWNLRNGACKKTVIGHEKGIACVQVDNRRIISGSNDDTVRIFDHASGAEVACLHGHGNLVRTVQAGFGDPPGAEETLRLEALAVDNAFRDAQLAGTNVDLGPRALRRAGYQQNTTGSRDPRDIKALGAKIPPGGGGSRWARIVSGSYDESIIIWKKCKEGRWVVGQRLRQEDAAASAAYVAFDSAARAATARSNAFAQQQQQQQQQHPQGASAAAAAAQGQPTPTAAVPPPAPQGGGGGPLQTLQALTARLAGQAQPQQPGGTVPSRAQPQPQPPVNGTVNPVLHPHPPPPQQQQQQQHSQHHRPRHHQARNDRDPSTIPTSRVFKLQFDAHKIICSSQDPRIVGWDFVGDDEELREACQFFRCL